MKNKKWKEFDIQTGKCYANMVGAEKDGKCWDRAFEILKEIIKDERGRETEFAAELYQLDVDTDFAYDVQGWLEDYLDETEMRGEYGKLLNICEELLGLFAWKEDSPSDIKLLKSFALRSLKRYDEAAEFCEKWLAEEPDNIAAVTANVYVYTALQNNEAAERLIKQHIKEDTPCTEENDILFTAASRFYQAAGNKKERKRVEQALEAYDKYLEELWQSDDDGEIWEDDELPFF